MVEPSKKSPSAKIRRLGGKNTMKDTLMVMLLGLLVACVILFVPKFVATGAVYFTDTLASMEGDWGSFVLFLGCLTIITYGILRCEWGGRR